MLSTRICRYYPSSIDVEGHQLTRPIVYDLIALAPEDARQEWLDVAELITPSCLIYRDDAQIFIQAFYWALSNIPVPRRRLPPSLRAQCSSRQNYIVQEFSRLVALKDDLILAKQLSGSDDQDSGLRLYAFLELDVEHHGPFGTLQLLQKISNGNKMLHHRHVPPMCCLGVCSNDAVFNLLATIVVSLGQRLSDCSQTSMSEVVELFQILLSHYRTSPDKYSHILPELSRMLEPAEFCLLFCLLLNTDMDHLWEWDTFKLWLQRISMPAQSVPQPISA